MYEENPSEQVIGERQRKRGIFDIVKRNCELTENNIIDEVLIAKREWIAAVNFFENARDAREVEYAIMRMNASEAKYTYFLRIAKKTGIKQEMW